MSEIITLVGGVNKKDFYNKVKWEFGKRKIMNKTTTDGRSADLWEDLNADRFNTESEFLRDVIKEHRVGNKVLSVGCGTGGHLRELQKMGFDCTGIDLNEDMLEYAKSKSEDIIYRKMDMKNMDFGDNQYFDFAYSLCSTFSYNRTNEEVVQCLQNYHSILIPGGVLVIETFNPICFLDGGIQYKAHMDEYDLGKENVYGQYGVSTAIDHRVDHAKQILEETRSFYDSESRDLRIRGNRV